MIQKNWWKILGSLLVLGALFIGILTPLRPGFIDLHPTRVKAGSEVTFKLTGYNSNYTSENLPTALLWFDESQIVNAKKVEVLNSRELTTTFQIPFNLTNTDQRQFKISVDDPENGFVTALKKVYIEGGEINPQFAKDEWSGTVGEIHDGDHGFSFPFMPNIYESIRNTFYHVPLWFAMFFLFLLGVIQSIKHLRTNQTDFDLRATSYTSAGVLFGILGLVTGMVWAKYTWGKAWSWDIKQTMTAVLLLIYGAYFVLRSSFEDQEKRARISAIYNIYAFIAIIPLLYVVPRLVDSLHPGGQGNPAFATGDLDMNARVVFYMAVLGWGMIGFWIARLNYRQIRLSNFLSENDGFD